MFRDLMYKEKVKLYVYEVTKGTKPVCLFTTPIEHKDEITHIITSAGLVCKTVELSRNVNYFFSLPENEDCIDTIMSIMNNRKLNELTLTEDILVGFFLGYSAKVQAERYKTKINKV